MFQAFPSCSLILTTKQIQSPSSRFHNTVSNSHDALLRQCARISLEDEEAEQIARACKQYNNWQGFSNAAENHGLAPLAYSHFRTSSATLPRYVEIELKALTLRHRLANQTRSNILCEILDACADAGINVLVLKGGALAHTIYPQPEFRPMRDLDLLVRKDQAARTQNILRDLGFYAPQLAANPYMYEHHHLPNATREHKGLTISIEVHHDALSRDVPGNIVLESLSDPPQRFEVAGRVAYTLGQHDMLRHLCHHMLEPAATIRLLSVVDLYGYTAHILDEVDWERIKHECPFIINTIALVHFLVPLPQCLRTVIPIPKGRPPTGIGHGIKPLSQIVRRGRRIADILQDLYYPSDWWLKAYYSVPNHMPLFFYRWTTHTGRLSLWFGQRLLAYLKHR